MRDLVLALKDRISRHNAPIFAAAVAFFAFLALIPALTAVIGIYGLVADPDDVARQISEALAGAPESTRTFIVEQMSDISAGSSGVLGLSVGGGLLLALFSASGAVANLLKALNVAYDLDASRLSLTDTRFETTYDTTEAAAASPISKLTKAVSQISTGSV